MGNGRKRRRLGELLRGFLKTRPLQNDTADIDLEKIADLMHRHAAFCARGEPQEYERRYQLGQQDFAEVSTTPGVVEFGIHKDGGSLVVCTECIDFEDEGGQLRELGEFIITIKQNPPTFHIENVTRKLIHCDHPHISGGIMCISAGKEQIMSAIAEGYYARALRIILTALRMRKGEVTLHTPYPDAMPSRWPLKQRGVANAKT